MNRIDTLRHSSRKLVRELGILELNKDLNLPSAQHCHAVVEIGQSPGITISELATRLILSLSAASRLVQSMIERGLVNAQDGRDRREKILSLSTQGVSELKKIDPLFGVSPQRLRRFAIDSPFVSLEIHSREGNPKKLLRGCPVCNHSLKQIKNLTIWGGEVTIEFQCPHCGYWTGKKKRIPTRYVFHYMK